MTNQTKSPSVFAKIQGTAFSVLDAVDHSAKAVAEAAWTMENIAKAARIKSQQFCDGIEADANTNNNDQDQQNTAG